MVAAFWRDSATVPHRGGVSGQHGHSVASCRCSDVALWHGDSVATSHRNTATLLHRGSVAMRRRGISRSMSCLGGRLSSATCRCRVMCWYCGIDRGPGRKRAPGTPPRVSRGGGPSPVVFAGEAVWPGRPATPIGHIRSLAGARGRRKARSAGVGRAIGPGALIWLQAAGEWPVDS